MGDYFMGYKIHTDIKYFLPNTVLLSKENDNITVAMARDVLDYFLALIAPKSPLIDSYKKAKTVLSAIKLRLENKQPPRLTKEDAKVAVDVLLEIMDESAKSDAEKERNARYASLCKLLINGFC